MKYRWIQAISAIGCPVHTSSGVHPPIPVAFQSATLLAALAHPDHLLLVGSWASLTCRLVAI
ncbi:MAG: hypothetical protein QS721_08210 [Candidatus Endonucleobacter sp. (ex Gigantidas childressi)]|nr:hypothetical protein [Candidatus Endonucleobacter sp. (ex Gigantidas childressi)]